MTAVDKVLAALDAGLQSSDERGYPPRIDHPALCARCLAAHHVEGGDLCQQCRLWMLGDSDEDPAFPRNWQAVVGALADADAGVRAFLETDVGALVASGGYCAPDPAWVAHHDGVGHVHSFDYIGQCECGVCDVGVRPSLRVRFQRLDRVGVPTGESQDLSGYVTMHLNGNAYDNRPENLRIVPARENLARIECPAQPDEEIVSVLHVERPAAYRVASSSDVPEWYAVTCDRCGAIYACDPQRTQEAAEIMHADGHGLAGACDPLTRTLRYAPPDCPPVPDEVVAFVSECVTSEPFAPYDWSSEGHDWLTEAMAQVHRLIADARERLGL